MTPCSDRVIAVPGQLPGVARSAAEGEAPEAGLGVDAGALCSAAWGDGNGEFVERGDRSWCGSSVLDRVLVSRKVLAYSVFTLFCLDGFRRVLAVPASLRWYDKLDGICGIVATSLVLGLIMFTIVTAVGLFGQPLQFRRAWHWVSYVGISIYLISAGLGVAIMGQSAVLLIRAVMVHPRDPEWFYLALTGFLLIAAGRVICYVLGR